MSDNPAAAVNNRHHEGYYRSEQEFWDSEFGRGPGDPDVVGHYPGEPTHNYPQEREESDVA